MKKNKAPLTQPLSERELDWLENYLNDQSQTYDDCMTLEAVDGLFCALILNPVMAKPSDWMKMVLGQKHAFESDSELENVLALLIRYWNRLAALIEAAATTETTEIYVPFIKQSAEESSHKLAEKWAVGFHTGMVYCANDWKKLADDEEHHSLLAPFILLKLGHMLDNSEAVLTHQERSELLSMIPENVYNLFVYWIEKASEKKQASSAEPKIKVGRNDPCPCGSGKKYKKCCDGKAPATIH